MIIVPKNEATSFNQDTITAVNGQVSAGLCMKYMCTLYDLYNYMYSIVLDQFMNG